MDQTSDRAIAFRTGRRWPVAAGSPLTLVMRGPVEDHAVVWGVGPAETKLSELVRARMDRLGEIDLASQDVLVDVDRTLEEQQWMLRVQLIGRS